MKNQVFETTDGFIIARYRSGAQESIICKSKVDQGYEEVALCYPGRPSKSGLARLAKLAGSIVYPSRAAAERALKGSK